MCGILGNSLSFVLTVLVLFVSGTSDDRGKAPGWSVHSHGIFMICDLGIYCMTLIGVSNTDVLWKLNEYVFKLCEKLFWNSRRYKLVSEPWFEGFEYTFGRIWTQTEDLRNIFKKSKRFLENAEQSRVYDQSAPERWFPKIPLYYMLWYWYDVFSC